MLPLHSRTGSGWLPSSACSGVSGPGLTSGRYLFDERGLSRPVRGLRHDPATPGLTFVLDTLWLSRYRERHKRDIDRETPP